MLRTVRRRLRLIRYYSASRPQTRWMKAIDIAPVVALALAVPVALMVNMRVGSTAQVIGAQGVLLRKEDGSWDARQTDHITTDPVRLRQGDVPGMWSLQVTEHRRGWPAVASVERTAVDLMLDLLDEPRPRQNVTLDATDPIRLAIEASLRADGPRELAVAWSEGPRTRPLWRGWVAAVLVWWIVLTALTVAFLYLMEHLWRLRLVQRGAQHEALRASGRCPACGYDMRGLDWNDRCPECGTLVY